MKNKSLYRFFTLLRIFNFLKEPVGSIFIQRAIFILQRVYGLELGYKFKLSLHGPYSEVLAEDLVVLEGSGFLTKEYNDEFGYFFRITKNGIKFMERLKLYIDDLNELNEKIDRLLCLLESWSLHQVELLGAIFYFMEHTEDPDQLVRFLQMLRPRYAKNEIVQVIYRISEQRFS